MTLEQIVAAFLYRAWWDGSDYENEHRPAAIMLRSFASRGN